VIGSERRDFQAALDKRDREIKLLRRELATLRSEVELKLKLKRELAAAQTEIEELRQRAPNFKAELDAARQEIAKQQKLINRLRGAVVQLEFEQAQASKEITLTGFRLTTEIGARTREAMGEVLEQLRASGFDVVDEMPPPL
jgi:predicted RNase H-like nuclease (RuvC/YqgF family)